MRVLAHTAKQIFSPVPVPPESLVNLQRWFTQALVEQNPRSELAEIELVSSPRVSANDRLAIYSQDYLVRHLKNLSRLFPGLQSLLGNRFISWMTAYLNTSGTSKELYLAGQELESFMEEAYDDLDKDLILEVTAFEAALSRSCVEADLAPLTGCIRIQPHVTVLKLNYDLITWYACRSIMPLIAQKPDLKKTLVIVYRTNQMQSRYEQIDAASFELLHHLQTHRGNLPPIRPRSQIDIQRHL